MFVEQTQQKECQLDVEHMSSVLWILADSYCRKILETIKEKPMSCVEISIETKIPISTVYRRMQELQDQKLVHTSGSITEDGKKYFLYKSRVQAIHATFDGKLELKVTRK
ncbi:helix-turn-helix domain-containing protein [Nitrosopumilus sp.]|uniref:winged helix-turn-helix domain-containing protein n=1 Tax=Nitrosopumilus sp. TaxID=2024843 RepID=UPI00260648EA|nr:helix-turn-helix domain-containing protein [Nitrosopumilus sp.]